MELKQGMMVRVRPEAGTMVGEKGKIVSSFRSTFLSLTSSGWTNSGYKEKFNLKGIHTVYRVKFNLKGKNVILSYLAHELEPIRVESIPFRSIVGIGMETEKVIIHDRTTILFYRDPATRKMEKAIAKCHPDDTFDKDIGIQVATLKALQKVAKSYMNQIGRDLC
jgi:hypothetical protein